MSTQDPNPPPTDPGTGWPRVTPGYGDPWAGQTGYGQPGYADPGYGQPYPQAPLYNGYAPQPYAPQPYAPQPYAGYGRPAQISSVGKLFAAFLLDGVLMLVTVWIGWLIWAAITAAKAQTPGKQLLNMQVVNADTGAPLDWPTYVLLRGFIGGVANGFAVGFTFYVLAFMPLWDRRNQTVAAKVSNSVVVDI